MVFIPEKDILTIRNRYLKRFNEFGIDVRTLNSGGEKKQFIRHTVHSQIGNLDNKSILDIGTGLADYYQFLISNGLKIIYTGYDILPEFISADKKRFPEASFEVRDIFKENIAITVDYIAMSQVFNNRYQFADNVIIVEKAMEKAFLAAKLGISIDMMTSYVDYEEDRLFYFSPEEMIKIAKKFTPFVVMRHDYLPYEFTLYLYKKPTFQID